MKIQRPLLTPMLISGKILVLYGTQQIGKTTLANDLIASAPGPELSIINPENLEKFLV